MLCMIINFALFIFIPINLFCWIIYRKNLHSDKLAGVERVNTMTAIKNIHSSAPILGLVSGGTPIYWLYRYVPLERVWFSSHLLCCRV